MKRKRLDIEPLNETIGINVPLSTLSQYKKLSSDGRKKVRLAARDAVESTLKQLQGLELISIGESQRKNLGNILTENKA